MKRTIKAFKKIIILCIGLPVLVVGIVLVPLPGPGVLIMLLALAILSLEFEQAQVPLQKAQATIKKIYDQSKERADRISGSKDK